MSATDRLIGTDEPAAWRAALEGVPHSFYASWDCCHAVALNTGRPTWLYVGERAGARVVDVAESRGEGQAFGRALDARRDQVADGRIAHIFVKYADAGLRHFDSICSNAWIGV